MSDAVSADTTKKKVYALDSLTQTSELEWTPNQAAAHFFLTELRTRISTQELPFRDGTEQAALTSLYKLFGLARKAIIDNPGCNAFAQDTVAMLNQDLRPITADWHRRSEAGQLSTRDGAIAFRQDLIGLQEKLREYAETLHQVAYKTPIQDTWGAGQNSENSFEIAVPMVLGVREDDLTSAEVASELGEAETAEIRAIRIANGRTEDSDEGPITEGTGLAFSGGGIRSASFSLGVAQELVEKELLKDFDLMSTVSGGGFTGALISRQMPQAGEAALRQPNGPDTDQIAYVRHRASYLFQGVDGRAQKLVGQILAGMLLNWTAPGLVIAAIALIVFWLPDATKSAFAALPIAALVVSTVGLLLYAAFLRTRPEAADKLLALAFAASSACLAGAFIRALYLQGPPVLQTASMWPLFGALGAALPTLSIVAKVFARPVAQKVAIFVAMAIAGIIVPLVCLIGGMLLYNLGNLPMDAAAHPASPLRYMPGHVVLLGVVLVLALLSRMIDINLTGPHRIYRDSLARTFVRSGDGKQERSSLESLNHTHKAPHHLINAVVNLPNSESVKLGERKGDFYLFSKTHCGSPTTGYHKTSTLETEGKPIDLGTAIATSGAAVAPHMALLSVAPARSLLAFLNLRLGFWLGISRDGKVRNRPGFGRLIREMIGQGLNEDAEWLYLTDGGHIENSGVYELLRRRCRYIVAVDAGADAPNTFGAQATLSRHARIDMGIELDLKLDDLRVDPNSGLSPSHAVLSKITYPAEGDEAAQTGLLLFIKLSMTGDEDEMIKAYKSAHPDFPIQSTADQFFDEAQFENYRRLGVHATRSLFSQTLVGSEGNPKDVGDWLRRLTRTLRP